MFLKSGSMIRRLASLHWLRAGGRSPASPVLSRRYDFPPSLPPHFVTFVWRYLNAHSFCSLPSGTSVPLRAWICSPGLSSRDLVEETTGPPKFLENLNGPFAMFQSDSGRTARTRPSRCGSVAPGRSTAKAPAKGLSRLNSMAFGLAVYASPDGLATHDARLASGRWSGSTGRASHPQGSKERFPICVLHLIPPSQALLAQVMQPLRVGRPIVETAKGLFRSLDIFRPCH